MEETMLAWAAGLFEGEGSITVRYEKPVMQMKMCDAEVVAKFRSVVGLGRVYGPYKNKTGERDGYPRQDFFVWTARSADCELVIERLWPWLSSYRRRRASEVGFAIAKHVETEVL
jgi:hypothetical protein